MRDNMKPTPGPWYSDNLPNVYSPTGSSLAIFSEKSGDTICRMVGSETLPAAIRDARLIAASPDLLAACERIMQEAQRDCIDESEWSEGERMAFAAIAKARGEVTR